MTAHVEIGGADVLTLKGALLVYEGRSRGFVSWHEVLKDPSGGAPFLGEAQALSTEFVHRLSQGLGTQLPLELFPESVLVRTAETIVWWTPPAMRTMFFRHTDKDAATLNGSRFPQPALLWKVAGQDLWVRALAGNRRPAANTKPMVAPYWNVNGETGWTCQGSMRSPDELGIAALPQWEKAFFESEFTHETGVRRLTTHPGGFFGLWREMSGERRFPAKYLVATNQSLEEFARHDR